MLRGSPQNGNAAAPPNCRLSVVIILPPVSGRRPTWHNIDDDPGVSIVPRGTGSIRNRATQREEGNAMGVLVNGHKSFIGSVIVPALPRERIDVDGVHDRVRR